MIRTAVLSFACICLLAACATREAPKHRSVFLRDDATTKVYAKDLTVCDQYAVDKGPTSADAAAATGALAIIGGIGGAMMAPAVHQGHKDARRDLFDECMYVKGYRLVRLPDGYGPQKDPATGSFDRRKAAIEMIEKDEVGELIAWENAKNSGDAAAIEKYLRTYPAGRFVPDANALLTAPRPQTGGTVPK